MNAGVSQQADILNRQLAALDQQIATVNLQLAQLTTSGGEGRPAPDAAIIRAQVNSLENQRQVVSARQQVAGEETAAAQGKCTEQAANPPRCTRKQRLTAAQRRDLEEQVTAVLGDTHPYRTVFPLYRCPSGAPR